MRTAILRHAALAWATSSLAVISGCAAGHAASPTPPTDPTCSRLLSYVRAGVDPGAVVRAVRTAGEAGEVTPVTTACLREAGAPSSVMDAAFAVAPDVVAQEAPPSSLAEEVTSAPAAPDHLAIALRRHPEALKEEAEILTGRPEEGFALIAKLPYDAWAARAVAAPLDAPSFVYAPSSHGLVEVDLATGTVNRLSDTEVSEVEAAVGGVVWRSADDALWFKAPGLKADLLVSPGQVRAIEAVASEATALVFRRSDNQLTFVRWVPGDPLGPDRVDLVGLSEVTAWWPHHVVLSRVGEYAIGIGTPPDDGARWELHAARVETSNPSRGRSKRVFEVTMFPVAGGLEPAWIGGASNALAFPISVCDECDLGADSTWGWALDPAALTATLMPEGTYDPGYGPLTATTSPDGAAVVVRYAYGGRTRVAVVDHDAIDLPEGTSFLAWSGAGAEPTPIDEDVVRRLSVGLREEPFTAWWPGYTQKRPAAAPSGAATPKPASTTHPAPPYVNPTGSLRVALRWRASATLQAQPDTGWEAYSGSQCRGVRSAERDVMDVLPTVAPTGLVLFTSECRGVGGGSSCTAELWCDTSGPTTRCKFDAGTPTSGPEPCDGYLRATVGRSATIEDNSR